MRFEAVDLQAIPLDLIGANDVEVLYGFGLVEFVSHCVHLESVS